MPRLKLSTMPPDTKVTVHMDAPNQANFWRGTVETHMVNDDGSPVGVSVVRIDDANGWLNLACHVGEICEVGTETIRLADASEMEKDASTRPATSPAAETPRRRRPVVDLALPEVPAGQMSFDMLDEAS